MSPTGSELQTGRKTEHAISAPTDHPLPASLSSLRSIDFRYLLAGTVLTQMGSWMQGVAQGWLVLTLTDSALYLGLAGFLGSIPMLLWSLPGGILADRVNRGLLLGIAQGIAAGFALLLAILVATGTVQLWQVFTLTFLIGSAKAMIFPVRQALVPSVVPRSDLVNAIGLNSAGNNVTRMAGPALAGVLIGAFGVATCYFVQVIGLFFAFWTSIKLKVPVAHRKASVGGIRGPFLDMAEAFRYIRQSPTISALIIAAAVPTIFAMPYINFLPLFARDLGIGATGLGLLMASIGIGAVAGSIAFAAAGDFRNKGKVQIVAILAFGLSLVGFALVTWLPGSLALLICAGFSSAVYMATNNTLLQKIVPDELRGRIMSVLLLTWGFNSFGTLPLGWVAEQYGAPWALIIGGGLCLFFALLLVVFRPNILNLE